MFFYVLFFIAVIIEVLIFSTLKIKIENLKVSTERYDGSLLNPNYKITISLWGLRKLRLFSIEIAKEKLDKLKLKEKLNKKITKINFQNIKDNRKINIKTLKKIKKFAPKISYINLVANIGTEDAIFTSYIISIISSVLGILLRKQMQKHRENKFIINPIYINKNLLNLELNCIIETKVILWLMLLFWTFYLYKKKQYDKIVLCNISKNIGTEKKYGITTTPTRSI